MKCYGFLAAAAAVVAFFATPAQAQMGQFDRVEFELVSGLELASYSADLDRSPGVAVHPDDQAMFSGSTSAPDPDRTADAAFYLGGRGALGNDRFRMTLGLRGRLNMLHFRDTRQGLFSSTQQAGDPRPSSQGSFVFTSVEPSWWTVTPSIGFASKPFRGSNLEFSAEVGMPIMQWEARVGHDRFGDLQTTERESWTGPGFSVRAAVGGYSTGTHPEVRYRLGINYEHFKTSFGVVGSVGIFGEVGILF